MNFKLLIQYDGTEFHGWQVQPKERTVQGELERVISLLDNREVNVAGSGRTDAGVHAEGQVANVNVEREFTGEKFREAINGNSWKDIRIMDAQQVDDDFHARFSAKGKSYVYRVVNANVISPFWSRYAHLERQPLDVNLMSRAARLFLGEHDWSAFSSAQSDSDNKVRTVNELELHSSWDSRAGASMIEFRISGNGFLRYMVRSIVGTLLEVGRGEKDSDTIQNAIITGDKNLVGATAPAHGLTLKEVYYG